jgi:hypothetical protein
MLAGIDTTQLGLEMQAHTHKHNVFIIKIFFTHQPGLLQSSVPVLFCQLHSQIMFWYSKKLL